MRKFLTTVLGSMVADLAVAWWSRFCVRVPLDHAPIGPDLKKAATIDLPGLKGPVI
jgi:hypothetical protein